MANLPPCPASLRPIAHYLKTAQEHDARDIIVAYWSRLYALHTGLKLSKKQADETSLLLAIMDWLETVKKQNASNESITNEVVAQAYLENYALKLFTYADQQDRASNFGKNVVKAFYTSGMIYDVLLTFGELSEEAQKNSRYAKWKAAYIHNCLKNGETPVPGPMEDESGEDNLGNDEEENENNEPPPPPASFGFQPAPVEQPFEHPTPTPPPAAPAASVVAPTTPTSPTGFQPYVPPPAQPSVPIYQPGSTIAASDLTPDQIIKANKYSKWASSALNFNDVPAAIENLQKALNLLVTGRDVE